MGVGVYPSCRERDGVCVCVCVVRRHTRRAVILHTQTDRPDDLEQCVMCIYIVSPHCMTQSQVSPCSSGGHCNRHGTLPQTIGA